MFDHYDVTLVFTEPLLGTVASDEEVYKRFIATKAPTEDPDETPAEQMADAERAGWTTFFRMPDDKDVACLMDYQVKGFLKEVGNIIKTNVDVKALRSKIEGDVFVKPRRIALGPVTGVLERPLRAMTAQGPRVTVVRSDLIGPGLTVTFTLDVREKSPVSAKILASIFEYGEHIGLGQWRSGGYGRFTHTLAKAVTNGKG